MGKALDILKNIYIGALDLVFPEDGCIICGKGKEELCGGCIDLFQRVTNYCKLCGKEHSGSLYCRDCLRGNRYFDGGRSLYRYRGRAKWLVRELKFNGRERIGEILGRLIAKELGLLYKVDYVVPIPLSKERLAQRGYNQALLIAKGYATELDLKFEEILAKTKSSRPHSGLSRDKRLLEAKGAFSLVDGVDIEDKSILLIDDVFTTGATVSEASLALKTAGALNVYFMTFTTGLG